MRAATSSYRLLVVAKAAGYGLLKDKDGIACIDNPGVGAMGVHYANTNLVGDGRINMLTPEAMVYEPRPNGKLRLAAVEWVVFQDAWDAAHDGPPSLFGEDFMLTPADNRYGLPAVLLAARLDLEAQPARRARHVEPERPLPGGLRPHPTTGGCRPAASGRRRARPALVRVVSTGWQRARMGR